MAIINSVDVIYLDLEKGNEALLSLNIIQLLGLIRKALPTLDHKEQFIPAEENPTHQLLSLATILDVLEDRIPTCSDEDLDAIIGRFTALQQEDIDDGEEYVQGYQLRLHRLLAHAAEEKGYRKGRREASDAAANAAFSLSYQTQARAQEASGLGEAGFKPHERI